MPPLPRSQSATLLFVSPRDTRHKARGGQAWPGGHPGPLKVIFHPLEPGVEGIEGLLVTLSIGSSIPQIAWQEQPVHEGSEVWGEHESIPRERRD